MIFIASNYKWCLCWLVVSTPLKNLSQMGSLSQLLGKITTMFQTTNQLWCLHHFVHFTSTFSWENYNISLPWIKAVVLRWSMTTPPRKQRAALSFTSTRVGWILFLLCATLSAFSLSSKPFVCCSISNGQGSRPPANESDGKSTNPGRDLVK